MPSVNSFTNRATSYWVIADRAKMFPKTTLMRPDTMNVNCIVFTYYSKLMKRPNPPRPVSINVIRHNISAAQAGQR